MAIPSVMQGLIETEDGKVFELDSPKGTTWLETIGSFRFEPSGDSKAYTVRKEPNGYWYGCRKIAGTVRKKYIGKLSDVNIVKLEEIAEALEIAPVPVPRIKQVAEVAQGIKQVAEVAQGIKQVAEVAQGIKQVAEVAQDRRLTTLESEVANLREAVKALQEVLPGKFEAGDSEELPKVDSEVAKELQNELSNLKAENEKLRADYDALLESSTAVADNLRRGVRELQARLEVERADREEVEAQLADRDKQITELRSQLTAEQTRYAEKDEEFWELHEQWDGCKKEIRRLEAELADLKQKPATASEDLPEAANILKDLRKALGKKSTASLADVETILEILEGDSNE